MKKNKLIKTIALTLALSSLGAAGASAAGQPYWKLSNNNWYYYDSNGKIKSGWIYDKGNWYYCYSNGVMAKNTTIDGYYLNANGAWTINKSYSNSEFTWEDVEEKHILRGDISQREDDIRASEQLSNYNVDLTEDNKIDLGILAGNLAQRRLYISEVRNNCIGKTINNKYRITDIKYLNKVFSTTTGTSSQEEINAVKNSDMYSYKPKTAYYYDKYLIYSCGNDRSSEWEGMRIVVELEAL